MHIGLARALLLLCQRARFDSHVARHLFERGSLAFAWLALAILARRDDNANCLIKLRFYSHLVLDINFLQASGHNKN